MPGRKSVKPQPLRVAQPKFQNDRRLTRSTYQKAQQAEEVKEPIKSMGRSRSMSKVNPAPLLQLQTNSMAPPPPSPMTSAAAPSRSRIITTPTIPGRISSSLSRSLFSEVDTENPDDIIEIPVKESPLPKTRRGNRNTKNVGKENIGHQAPRPITAPVRPSMSSIVGKQRILPIVPIVSNPSISRRTSVHGRLDKPKSILKPPKEIESLGGLLRTRGQTNKYFNQQQQKQQQNQFPTPNYASDTSSSPSPVPLGRIMSDGNLSFITYGFDCEICLRIFPTQVKLLAHMEKFHPPKVPVSSSPALPPNPNDKNLLKEQGGNASTVPTQRSNELIYYTDEVNDSEAQGQSQSTSSFGKEGTDETDMSVGNNDAFKLVNDSLRSGKSGCHRPGFLNSKTNPTMPEESGTPIWTTNNTKFLTINDSIKGRRGLRKSVKSTTTKSSSSAVLGHWDVSSIVNTVGSINSKILESSVQPNSKQGQGSYYRGGSLGKGAGESDRITRLKEILANRNQSSNPMGPSTSPQMAQGESSQSVAFPEPSIATRTRSRMTLTLGDQMDELSPRSKRRMRCSDCDRSYDKYYIKAHFKKFHPTKVLKLSKSLPTQPFKNNVFKRIPYRCSKSPIVKKTFRSSTYGARGSNTNSTMTQTQQQPGGWGQGHPQNQNGKFKLPPVPSRDGKGVTFPSLNPVLRGHAQSLPKKPNNNDNVVLAVPRRPPTQEKISIQRYLDLKRKKSEIALLILRRIATELENCLREDTGQTGLEECGEIENSDKGILLNSRGIKIPKLRYLDIKRKKSEGAWTTIREIAKEIETCRREETGIEDCGEIENLDKGNMLNSTEIEIPNFIPSVIPRLPVRERESNTFMINPGTVVCTPPTGSSTMRNQIAQKIHPNNVSNAIWSATDSNEESPTNSIRLQESPKPSTSTPSEPDSDPEDSSMRKKKSEPKCWICHKKFQRRGSVRRHMVGVHLRNEFPCELCDRYFSYKYCLTRHIREIHEKLKQVKCPQCAKKNWEGQEEAHKEKCKGKRAVFPCGNCDRVYMSAQSLRVHIRVKHNKVYIPCQFCTHKSKYNVQHLKHMRTYHPNCAAIETE